MAYTFIQLAEDVLKKAQMPLSAKQIWRKGEETGLDKRTGATGKSPAETLRVLLSRELRDNSGASKFIGIGRRPVRFFLKSRESEILGTPLLDLVGEEDKGGALSYKEKDLHSLLAYFAFTNQTLFGERQVYTKTINASKTKKGVSKALKQWLHPDMVGVYFPFEDMEASVVKLSGALSANSAVQIFSFELKQAITRSNYRECFFQAVSNSSWAQEGYLVAAEVSDDEELLRELERLTNAFGIGIIHLDLEDIDASKVLFQAKAKQVLDWETINKLCEVNEDFSTFIERLNIDLGASEIRVTKYDEILDDPNKYIRDKFKVKTATR